MAGNMEDKHPILGRKIEHSQMIMLYLMIYDAVAVTASYFLALFLRFDFRFSMIPAQYFDPWLRFAPFYAVVCVGVFYVLRLYRSIWRFASFTELARIIQATILTGIIHTGGITLFFGRMPISYYLMGITFQFVFITGIRFAYRFVLLLRASRADKKEIKNVMLIGAGAAGQVILRDIKSSDEIKEKVVCIIDDNSNKWNREIDGVPVVGGRGSIIENAVKYDVDKIYFSIPSASNLEKKKILEICNETGCEIMTLPGLIQLVHHDVSMSELKKVEVEDLLGREPVQLMTDEIKAFLNGKKVIVTGGGGSIGSEICRQVAKAGVKQLIVFDIYENNAHAIQLELQDKYPELDLVVLIGSVRNSRRLNKVFSTYHPDICFHAAAHKHVPLMEGSPCEAIKNNTFGTYNTAYAAMAYGCKKFVLISTDKAVNPVNIMGASKRLCEMVVQTFANRIVEGKADTLPDIEPNFRDFRSDFDHPHVPKKPVTEFCAVRFGNVLGSNGSVVPRFREQIEKGGPVTVTHPDIIRYFMTIPEASTLVLQAAAFGGAGNIFVLDMGTPVKIDDMARSMIKLAGLKPDVDIKIEYTGLRPGEKLYEERLMDEEGLQSTANDRISIGQPIKLDEDKFLEELIELQKSAYSERDDIRQCVSNMVPTYKPAGKRGNDAKGAAYEHMWQTMELDKQQINGGGYGETKYTVQSS